MTLGDRLKHYRKIKGITQEELAIKVGLSYRTIQRYEADASAPTNDKLLEIAKVLDIRPAYLSLSLEITIGVDEYNYLKSIEHKYRSIQEVLNG